MDISIIIVNYNSLDFIKGCIKSIEGLINESGVDCEVLIVDNNSGDGSVGYLKEKNKRNSRFSLIANSSNLGFSRAKILNANGTLQLSPRSFPTLARQFYESYFLHGIFKKSRIFGSYFLSWWDHRSVREVDWLTGSFMFIRKDYFLKAGMFDEDYFMYSEDADLCLKLHKMNFTNYYFPGFVIEHSDSGIASKDPAVREAGIWRSRRLYFKKNYSRAHAVALSLLYLAGVLNRIFIFTVLSIFKPGSKNKTRLASYIKVFGLYYKNLRA